MAKIVMFHPNDKQCKYPTGALKVNETLKMSLSFTRPQVVVAVYLVLRKDGEERVGYPMEFVRTQGDAYVYEIELPITSAGLYFYHFVLQSDHEDIRVGADTDLSACYGKGIDWQLTVYEDKYQPAKWLNGGVMYQILPDRFNIGGERLATKSYAQYRSDWDGVPEYRPNKNGEIVNEDFFGGNIKGITKKLSYLKNLGVNCLYINPIFEGRSNHKFDTGSYLRIDSDFGTEDDLKELIKKAGKKGIKIVLDGVFSHTGSDSIYFNKSNTYDSVGAYQSTNSPYYRWYDFRNFPNKYSSRWGLETLPQVNCEEPSYKEFITGEDGVIRRWTKLGLGGWRIGVVDELSDGFLLACAKAVKAVNPDALVFGEVWEDASNKIIYGKRRQYLLGEQLDSVTNMPFREDILNFVRCGDARRLDTTINFTINNYPKRTVDNLVNALSTHDTARILTVLGDNGVINNADDKATAQVLNPARAIKNVVMATTLQYTLPGVPCVYYGDEIGMEGFEDPFNRRPLSWNSKNSKLLRHYKNLGKLRANEHQIFADGEYKLLEASEGVFAFAREKDGKQVIVIVNNTKSTYVPNLEGDYTDLLTYKPFSNSVSAHSVAVVKLTQDTVFPQK